MAKKKAVGIAGTMIDFDLLKSDYESELALYKWFFLSSKSIERFVVEENSRF